MKFIWCYDEDDFNSNRFSKLNSIDIYQIQYELILFSLYS